MMAMPVLMVMFHAPGGIQVGVFYAVFLDDVLLVASFYQQLEELHGDGDQGDYAEVFWCQQSCQYKRADDAQGTLKHLDGQQKKRAF